MDTQEALTHGQLYDPQEIINHQNEEICALLHSRNQELLEVLGNIDQIIWYIDIKTLSLQYVNDAIEPIFGFAKEDFLVDHTLWQKRIHPDDRLLVQSFFETLAPGISQEIRFRIHRSSGELCWLNSRIYHNDKLHLFVGITSDITQAKCQSDEIEFLAYFDPLTMLPNRSKLKLQLNSKIDHYPASPFALALIDLDNFKNVNDTMGHDIGDKILIEVGSRLRMLCNETHFPVRFGGDEFIILFNTDASETINTFCNQLIQTFKTPFIINDIPFFLSCSIGISLYPEDARTSDDLIKHSDTAMYEAKKNGKNQFVYYHSSMQRAIHNFLHIESLIRDGLKDDLFELYFQPLINTQTNALQGFEALLRLPHPVEGFVGPDTFISVAEKNGDILQIGEEVMLQACEFITHMRSIYNNPFYVAINVSAKQLHQSTFAHNLLLCLSTNNIPSQYLRVELTESAVMDNITIATHQLQILEEGGVKISLDDFGTGYSSFSYLAQLPITTLKIDKSFIQTIHESDSHRNIVQTISQLANTLGMEVTAEGIETEEQFNFLAQHPIQTLQGFLFAKPMQKSFIYDKLMSQRPFFVPESILGFAI
jgi:diguanylate cyclase (GGDEF)-like protein/PAS domain S-box-containing protein